MSVDKASVENDYRNRIAAMTDVELFAEAKHRIWLSAYANNNPRSDYHWQCDATYDEAKRRGKTNIYSRAHKSVESEVTR